MFIRMSLEPTHRRIKPVHTYALVIQVLSYSTNVLCAFLISVRAKSLAGLLSVFHLIFWKLFMSMNAGKKGGSDTRQSLVMFLWLFNDSPYRNRVSVGR